MNVPPRPSSTGDRDPACHQIEVCLRQLETDGEGRLSQRKDGTAVVVSFGTYSVQAVDYDIALVRLARAMVDDRNYGPPLRQALDLVMPSPDSNDGGPR